MGIFRALCKNAFWPVCALMCLLGLTMGAWILAWFMGYIEWRMDISIIMCALFAALMLAGGAGRLFAAHRKTRVSARRRLVWLYRLSCAALAVCLGVQCAILTNMWPAPSPTANTMVVLGAGIIGDQPSEMLRKRLDKALECLSSNPELVAIVSGGQGRDEAMPESRVMKAYLVSRGVAENRIIEDDISNNTTAQMVAACALMRGQEGNNGVLLIVSSDYHLYRASLLAGRAGVKAERAGSGTSWTVRPFAHMRETLSVAWTWLGLDFERN